MSRKTWTEIIEDMISKLEAEKKAHREAIRRHEDMIINLHNQIRANRKDLEEAK
jgi:hypothetical protein